MRIVLQLSGSGSHADDAGSGVAMTVGDDASLDLFVGQSFRFFINIVERRAHLQQSNFEHDAGPF